MKKVTFIFLLSISVFSCKIKKEIKHSSNNATSAEVDEPKNDGIICNEESNGIYWTKINDPRLDGRAHRISSDFRAFAVDNNRLKDVLEKFRRSQSAPVLNLPLYVNGKVECARMELISSGTLSDEAQDTHGVYSYKAILDGYEISRVDYNLDNGLRAYFKKGNQSILFEPIKIGTKTYYICFDKKSSLVEKRQFEK